MIYLSSFFPSLHKNPTFQHFMPTMNKCLLKMLNISTSFFILIPTVAPYCFAVATCCTICSTVVGLFVIIDLVYFTAYIRENGQAENFIVQEHVVKTLLKFTSCQ